MLVFSYAVELDAIDSQAEGYDETLREAVKAYRTRAACFELKGDSTAAQRDLKRALSLEAKVKKPDDPTRITGAAASLLPGRVTVANDYAEAVSLVIGGITYTVPAGASKTLATPTGTFPYEMVTSAHRITGSIEAGKTYRIKPPAPTGQ